MIKVDMVDAIKVQFLKPIFEDDFVEKGMKAWLTDIEWDKKYESYKLYFDFSAFEAENDKYFKRTYYGPEESRHIMRTAKEAGYYDPKCSMYLSVTGDVRDDEKFEIEIKNYLRIVE